MSRHIREEETMNGVQQATRNVADRSASVLQRLFMLNLAECVGMLPAGELIRVDLSIP